MAELDNEPSVVAPDETQKHERDEKAPASPEKAPQESSDYNDETASQTDPDTDAPPLPSEDIPPLPDEPLPSASSTAPAEPKDDGWEPVWDENLQAFYFYNRFTQQSQWENPRVPEAATAAPGTGVANHDRIDDSVAPGTSSSSSAAAPPPPLPGSSEAEPPSSGGKLHGGYNPAIHGSYDPNADYARLDRSPSPPSTHIPYNPYLPSEQQPTGGAAPGTEAEYAATALFNRFTGRFQAAGLGPENFNDENKSRRQMNAYFDVDAAANAHDGRSLRAERQNKKLTKAEVKAFREKRREKKEEKRRAWLRD